MSGWFAPTPLGVFVLGVAILLIAATGGLVWFTPLFGRRPHASEKLGSAATKIVAILGVLCLVVSGGFALRSWMDRPPGDSPQPSSVAQPSTVPILPSASPTPSPSPTPVSPPDQATPPSTTSRSTSKTPLPLPPPPPAKNYLQDNHPLGSPNVLNSNPTLTMGGEPYPHSVTIACVRGGDGGVVYSVGGYSKLHATIGLSSTDNGPGRADDIPCQISITNNAGGQLADLTFKPSSKPQTLDVDLRGADQMKIICLASGQTKAGYDVNYKIGFGNAELL
jgi:hypothetical protein